MEIGLKYNLDLFENVTNILSTDFWVLEKFSYSMIPQISDPVKFSSNVSVLVREGECNVSIDLINYKVKAPCIVNIRKSQILQLENVSKNFEASFIVMSKRFCDNLFLLLQECPAYSVTARHPVVNVDTMLLPKFEKFYTHISEIFSSSKDTDAYQAMVLAIASFFYECGAKCYYPLMDNLPKNQNRLPEKFLSLVQQNFKKERFLEYYATKLDVTTKHLSRIVKSVTGFTGVEWIDRYVVLEAKVLLKSTNLTIQQIADELNFSSQSLFGKYFKKHTGLTPKDFRNIQ